MGEGALHVPRLAAPLLGSVIGASPCPADLTIALGDDLAVEVVVDRVERPGPRRVVRIGHASATPGSWFILAQCGDAVMGEVSVPGAGHFHVRSAGSDAHVWQVESASRLNYHSCAGAAALSAGPLPARPTRFVRWRWHPETTATSALTDPARLERPESAGSGCGGQVTIDVLVVYTAAAQSIGGQDAIEALIDSYVAYTNMVYADSGVDHRLRLVHTQQVAYTDSGNILLDLERITDPDDGFLDDVHPLRDEVGADLVSLISNTASAGAAWGMIHLSVAFESMAFSVLGADPGPLPGGLVFAHETGHNLGSQHNNGPQAAMAVFCFSYGYRTPDQQWRTIMSGPPGAFVDRFSSPLLEVDGQALGVPGDGCPDDAADNVTSLNFAAPTAAMFRPTVVPPACPGDANGDGVVDVADMVLVILNWGPCPEAGVCPGDVNRDGVVDVIDLVLVITSWTGI